MALLCIACTCGSADKLVRSRLEHYGYRDFLTIPIIRGKEKSKSALNSIPQYPEVDMAKHYLDGCSKYALVVGYDDVGCRWVDLANGKAVQNNIDLEFILRDFT